MIGLTPGMVLCVRTGGFAGTMIRLGAAFRGKPNLQNHVAVVHHIDAKGTVWCIEGRPGGVGWRDATAYLASSWTLTNIEQPFTVVQGAEIAKTMEAMLGTAYDWDSITADALSDLGMHLPGWDSKWNGLVAGQVVCSSAAAYAYGKNDVPHPPGDRGCQPSAWTEWILTRGWKTPVKLPSGTAPPPLMRGRFFRTLTEPR
jgi:hypothetical protein